MRFHPNKCILIGVLFLSLTACKEEKNLSYLMTHPAVVKQEALHCQLIEDKTAAQESHCAMVMQAATSLVTLINEQQDDPEKFGQTVLEKQMAYVKAKNNLLKAQQTLAALKAKNGPARERKIAENKLLQAEKTYHDLRDDIRVSLAVIGMNSPE